ncbi:unnamed protein product [Dovyalis caffra]|uniref:Uncharacterized protein n=1 Tax=Dovyalis caffra TaxID=77055 RepID=A0AAV1RN76_9ROSI|nr:unnamed protein product [Dovyalis caffra]
MSSATETLCGQAFGAGHYHMMGIYLQRSWIVDGVAATILLPLVIFATPIFRLLGQEDDVAIASGNISLVRVANELGRRNAEAAKFSIKIIISTSIIIGVWFWLLCLIFGKDISHFVTSDEEVAETMASLAVLLAFSILLNSVQPGLWMGLLSGVIVQTLILSYVIWRTDWDEQVNMATERLGRWYLKSENDSTESSTPV